MTLIIIIIITNNNNNYYYYNNNYNEIIVNEISYERGEDTSLERKVCIISMAPRIVNQNIKCKYNYEKNKIQKW